MADLSFLSNASGLYRSVVGGGSKPESYSTTFITPQGNYTFISEDVVNKGLNVGDNNYWFPYFQNQDNLTNLVNTAQQVDLSNVKASGITSSSTWGDWVSSGLKQSAKGYLVPEGAIPFDSDVKTAKESLMGEIKGLGKTGNGEIVYTTSGGHGNMYVAPDGMVHDPYITKGSSILGDIFGDLGESLASPIRDVSDFVHDLGPIGTIGLNVVSPGLGTAITVGNEAGRGNLEGAAINAALGEITGNSLGGEIGVQGTPIWAGTDPNAVGGVTGPDNIDVGGGFNPAAGATELTTQQVLDQIAADQAESMSAADVLAQIEADQAASAAANATPAQVAAAKAAGMSILDYAKAGLLVNAIAGDPLGLGGGQPEQGTTGATGFAQVPIPAEWKSPTYAAPSAPIDLESIFSNQNMLGGTQWQNLPNQQPNVSFNDIFAAGQQQTPIGTPVDINQIVSSILGQAATSQKPA